MRGQVTVFIILGALVVMLVGTVLYLNGQRFSPDVTLPRTEEVTEAAQPIQDYILSCLQDVGGQGLTLIGDHGGYLTLDNVPAANIDPVHSTESDILFLDQEGSYGVPYWWFMRADNECEGDCEFDSRRPNLYKSQGEPSIEGQLETYVEETLNTCLRNFAAFTEQGISVTPIDEPSATVRVTQDDVVIGLRQEFTATKEGQQNTLKEFAVVLPVHLRDIYELATNLTVLEAENGYLAKHARELITAYSRVAPDALPPVSSIEFKMSSGTSWVKYNVEKQLRDLLQTYVPLLQVFGTSNYNVRELPKDIENVETVGMALNRNALIPELRPFPGIEAHFSYLNEWDPYFDLNCKGQVCKAEGLINTISIFTFGVQRYSFAYDLSYPALVELREPDALDGRGFSFRFALEGNLRNNEPVTSEWTALKVPTPEDGSQVCNENQRTSGVVNVTTIDTFTNKGMDAAVTYWCGEDCLIGSTAGGELSTQLPRCLGGSLSATQVGYVGDRINFNTNTEEPQQAEIALHPIITINVTAAKYRLKKDLTGSWNLDPTKVSFSNYDQAIITLRRDTGRFSTVANVCGNPLSDTDNALNKNVRITAGNYTVTISTLYHGNITFPPTRRCSSYKKFVYDDKRQLYGDPRALPREKTFRECYFVPDKAIYFGNVPPENVTLNNITVSEPRITTYDPGEKVCASEKPFPSGTVIFRWEVTPEMLRIMKNVQFNTITMGAEIPGPLLLIEDFEQIGKTQVWADAEPKFVVPDVNP